VGVKQVDNGDRGDRAGKERLKGIARAAAVAMALLFLAGSAALLFLNSGLARGLLLSRVNGLIPGTLSVESHRFFPWKGELLMNGLSLITPEGEDVIAIGGVAVELSWSRLARGIFLIGKLRIDHPRGLLNFDKDGASSLDRALFPPRTEEEKNEEAVLSSGIPLPLVLERVEVSGGRLGLSMTNGLVLDFREIEVTGSADLLQKEGAARVRVGGGTVSGRSLSMPLRDSEVRMELKGGGLEKIEGKIDAGASSLSLSGSLGDVFGNVRPDLEFRLSGSLGEIAGFVEIPGEVSGRLILEGRIGGSLDDPAAALRGDIGRSAFRGYPVDGGRIDLQFRDRVLSVRELELAALGGTLAGSGKMDFQKAFPRGFGRGGDLSAVEYEGTWKEEGGRLEAVPPLTGRVSGRLAMKGSVRGRGLFPERAALTFSLEGQGASIVSPSVRGSSNVQFGASGEWKEGTLSVSTVRAGDENLDLRGEGWFSPAKETFRGDLTVTAGDLSRIPILSEFVPLAGTGRLEAAGSGSLEKPSFTVRLVGKGLGYRDISIGDADGEGKIGPSGDVEISRLVIGNKNSKLQLAGSASLFRKGLRERAGEPVFRVSVQGDPVFLQDFYGPFRGKTVFEAFLEGTWKNPRGEIRLEGRDLQFPDQPIANLSANITLDGRKIVVHDLTVAPREGESIEASGWFVPGGPYEGKISASGVSLDSIGWIEKRAPVKGTAIFHMTGKGEMKNPAAEGKITLKNVIVADRSFGDFSFLAEARQGAATLAGNGDLPVKALYNWQTGDFFADLSLAEKDLTPFFGLSRLPGWGGEAAGTVHLEGNARRPEKIDGKIALSSLRVLYDGAPVASADDLLAEIRDGVLFLPGSRVRLMDRGEFRLEGKGALEGALDFRMDGSVPLAVIGPFVAELADLEGQVTCSARAGGTLSHPDFQGEILLDGLGATILPLMERVREVRGKIGVTEAGITVEQVRGYLEQGPFSLEGTIALKDLKPGDADLRLKAGGLPFLVPNTLQVVLDADLTLRGKPEESRLEGTVTVVEGLYYKKMGLDLKSLLMPKRSVSPPRSPAALPYLKNLALDVLFRHKRPFLVDNNMARLIVAQDLRAGGTWNAPLLFGRVTIQSGTVTYQDRTFTIDRGIIDFTNPYRIDPLLEIQSHVQVRDWVIRLDISGTGETLKFVLSSAPQEEDQDILALLLFGKTTRELAGASGGTPASPQQMLAELIASTLSGQVREMTGLDVFEIQAGTSGEGETGRGVQVTLGKQVTRRLGVEYNVGSEDGEIVQEAVGEYKVFEGLLLRGFQNSRGAYGGEIQIRFEFR